MVFVKRGEIVTIDGGAVRYCVDVVREEHRRGERDNSRKIWTVLVFCLWHAIFVERSLDPGIVRAQSALLTKPARPGAATSLT